VPLAMGTLVAAHHAHRQHPMGADQPSDGYGVGRRGRGGLVTVKEHRGILLGVRPRPVTAGAGPLFRGAPIKASRDVSREAESFSDMSQVFHRPRTERVRKLRA
jgi:hypothetical protein